MSLLEAILLGIVQGLTEFLPISSSGHLVLGEFLLKVKFDDISFEVFLHLGTFGSVVIVFRRTLWSMLKAVGLNVRSIFLRKVAFSATKDWHLFLLILIGSVPAGVAGVLFCDYVEESFSSVVFVSLMLLFTGTILIVTQFFKPAKEKLNFKDAILVGVAQALALFPGISRSGLTISTGIFAKVKRSTSAEFSFLLSLPAILGASLLELKEVLGHINSVEEAGLYLTGTVTAFLVGYLAIKFLLNVIEKGKFQYFGYYCFVVGLFFLLFSR